MGKWHSLSFLWSALLLLSLWLISCDTIIPELDASPELTFSEAGTLIDLAGFEGAGEQAGSTAGSLAGSQAGTIAGNVFAGEEIEIGDASVSGGSIIDPQDCGSITCDSNAVCISDPVEPYCECGPRFEGSGESCSPQACPTNASGAPTVNVMMVIAVSYFMT